MDRFGYNQPFLVKKSPVVIVKNFIVLQMAAVAVFFLSGILLDYGEIYEHLPFSTSLSFHIVEAIGIFILETALIFYIFFRWYKEYYDIKADKIVHGRGIIFRRRTVILLNAVSSVSYWQGPLGKLTKYGNVELKDKNSGQNFVMDHIPEPQHYVDFLIQLKDILGYKGLKEGKLSLEELLAGGEHERLEFKTSFRWDFNQEKVNKNLERAVMKTVVAFLNSGGGQLLIGVNDSGNVIGLDRDYRSLPKPNADGFQNHFTNVFHAMVGPEFRQFIELNFAKAGDKECCLVNIVPTGKPAYLKLDNGEEFYIRTGNGTTSLKLSEAASYIDSHWKGRLL
ncbi:MAG: putative DNA binding domain-containing protein [Candidatus Taylorbacteria bacterium]|nr:putative DNA binding domain-containing protein [Candidatus Taylorbacteria bacterium]